MSWSILILVDIYKHFLNKIVSIFWCLVRTIKIQYDGYNTYKPCTWKKNGSHILIYLFDSGNLKTEVGSSEAFQAELHIIHVK